MNNIQCAENMIRLKEAIDNYCGLNEVGQEAFDKAINALLHRVNDGISLVESARGILWEECKTILRENTSEKVPVLYPGTEAQKLYDKKVEEVQALTMAIYILEDMRKDGKL